MKQKKDGIRYITDDNKYRIQKVDRNAVWKVLEVTGHGHKVIEIFDYFHEAKQYLREMLEK